LHTRLSEVWTELSSDPGCSVVILTGSGSAFSAEGDMDLLRRMNEDSGLRAAVLNEGKRMVESLIRFPLPVMAAVNGAAVGLGCSLAGLSDVVLIEESAFLADPHVSVGLVAGDGGAITWPAMMSVLRVKESTSSPATGSPTKSQSNWDWPTGSCPMARASKRRSLLGRESPGSRRRHFETPSAPS
jgi:enoyl-CoA hydratase